MLWEGLDIPAPFVVVGFIGLLVLPFSWISCPKNNAVLGVFDFPSFCLFVLLRRGCIYLVSLFYFLLAGIKRKKEKRKGRAVFRTVHLCDSYVHVYFPFVSDGFTPPWDSCCRRRWLPVTPTHSQDFQWPHFRERDKTSSCQFSPSDNSVNCRSYRSTDYSTPKLGVTFSFVREITSYVLRQISGFMSHR